MGFGLPFPESERKSIVFSSLTIPDGNFFSIQRSKTINREKSVNINEKIMDLHHKSDVGLFVKAITRKKKNEF